MDNFGSSYHFTRKWKKAQTRILYLEYQSISDFNPHKRQMRANFIQEFFNFAYHQTLSELRQKHVSIHQNGKRTHILDSTTSTIRRNWTPPRTMLSSRRWWNNLAVAGAKPNIVTISLQSKNFYIILQILCSGDANESSYLWITCDRLTKN